MENETVETIDSKEIDRELNILKGKVYKDIEKSSLIVVQVGNKDVPASKGDIERTAMSLNSLFKKDAAKTRGVKVLVLPHLITVDVIPLPILRKIESELVNSFDEDYDEPIVIGLDLLGGLA